MTNLPESWCVSAQDPQFEEFKRFFQWITKDKDWVFGFSYYGKDQFGYGAMRDPNCLGLTVAQIKETIEWQEYLIKTDIGYARQVIHEMKNEVTDPFKAFNEKIEEEARELWRSVALRYDDQEDCFEMADAAYETYIERFSKKTESPN